MSRASGLRVFRFAVTVSLVLPGAALAGTGACTTFTSPICQVTDQTTCINQGMATGSITTKYLGDGSTCPPAGACKLPDGSCKVLDAYWCAGFKGTYQGDGTACTTGACTTFTSPICQITDQSTCYLRGSTGGSITTKFLGYGTICPPAGACKLPDGTCKTLDSFWCAGLRGTYQGDGSVCTTGACTSPISPLCQQTSQAGCMPDATGALRFLGIGTACPPTGACTLPDGGCKVMDATWCTAVRGTYQGNGSICTTGACTSFMSPVCQQTDSNTCGLRAQTSPVNFLGIGTACPPTGACALPDGTCKVVDAAWCRTLSGTYRGDTSACAVPTPTGIPPTPTAIPPTPTAIPPTPTATPSTVPAGWTSSGLVAADIAVGANGAVWFINPNDSIAQLTSSGPVPIPGGGYRIAVDGSGQVWVVNRGAQVWKWNGSWQLMPGSAIDVAAGGGKVWILQTDKVPASWNGSGWTPLSGGGERITVDASGNVWVVNAGYEVWRYANNAWQRMPGGGIDLSAGPDGSVYILGTSSGPGGNQVWRWTGSSWILETGVFGTAVAAGSGLHAWVARGSALPVITR